MSIRTLTRIKPVDANLLRSVEDLRNFIVKFLNPIRVYLIGSILNQSFHEDSDVDFVIVVETKPSMNQMTQLHSQRPHKKIPVDFLVVDNATFEKYKTSGGICFEANLHGKLIYQEGVILESKAR